MKRKMFKNNFKRTAKVNGGGLLKVKNLNNFKIILLLGILPLLFLFGVNKVEAATYYVNTGGDDSYNGLYETFQSGADGPWSTIGHAVDVVPGTEDNTVYIAAGTYDQEGRQNQGYMNDDFTVTFQAQGAVIVQAKNNDSTTPMYYLYGDGTWIFKGATTGSTKTFVVDLYNFGDGGTGDPKCFYIPVGSSSDIILEDMEIFKGSGTTDYLGVSSPTGSFTLRRCYIHDFHSNYGPVRAEGPVIVESSYLKNWGGWYNYASGETKFLNNTFYSIDTGDILLFTWNTLDPIATIQNNLFLYGGSVTDVWVPITHKIDADITWNVGNNMAWKVGTLSSPRDHENYSYINNWYNKDDIVNNLIVVDPLATSPSSSAQISDISLAIGRGMDTGVTTGFNGVAFTNGRYDIGAWAVGDDATKQYIDVNEKLGLVVGDSFCDGNTVDGETDDFDEALINRSYFSDWTFIKNPTQNDSPCFTGRKLIEIVGVMGEFVQDNGPEAVFLVGGFNDINSGSKSATWVSNQVTAYKEILDDLTNSQAQFIYTTQPDDGCTPTTTIADNIENLLSVYHTQSVERFKDDNLWTTYYTCPTDGVHPNATGYAKMAEYAEEAYITYYDSTENVITESNTDSYTSASEGSNFHTLSTLYGLTIEPILTNFTLLNGSVFLNSDTTFQNSLFGSGVTFSGAGTPIYSNSWRTDVEGDPYINNDGTLKSNSPAIDAGSGTIHNSSTVDSNGNSIYGIPDMGAYEYQPPYTVGTDNIPTTGSIRIYSDGKYRMKTATSTTAVANFNITPSSGIYQATTTQYMDISLDSWLTTGTYNKQWTATSTTGDFLTHATSTIYTIGDLLASTYYQFKLDDTATSTAITGDNCTDGTCLSNSSGVITFTYTGGYSTHTFALEQDQTGPNAFTTSSPTNNQRVEATPTLVWNATTDDESALSHYALYVDGALNTDNLTETSKTLSSQSCGEHTWYIKAVDNEGNTTDSDTNTFIIACDSGSPGTVTYTPPIASRQQTIYPDGRVVYADELEEVKESLDCFAEARNDGCFATVSARNETQWSDEAVQQPVFQFLNNLYKGSNNQEVINLQQLLRELKIFNYESNTGYYGTITETAVKAFQCKYNIVCEGTPQTTGYGRVGPKTREQLNWIASSQSLSAGRQAPREDEEQSSSLTDFASQNPSLRASQSEAIQNQQLKDSIQTQIDQLQEMVEALLKELEGMLE